MGTFLYDIMFSNPDCKNYIMKEGDLLPQEVSELIRGVLTGKDISKIARLSKVSSSLLSQILYQQTGLTKKNMVAVYNLLNESLKRAKQKEVEFAEKRQIIEHIITQYNKPGTVKS